MYDHLSIEPKWQKIWANSQAFLTPDLKPGDPKDYILVMFPYPSGTGLHVGHLLGYTGTDIIARVARMQGKKVLHPMGWDAFGLPAENYAIKSGVHPAITTAKNTKEYKRQLQQIGMSYDWEREIDTSSPEFYKWTQWLFTLLYERGLAYRKEAFVNWCPSCQTVLANEQVVGGLCDRCGSQVIQKKLKQWYFKITDYADRLLEGLDVVNWPERIKTMQRNWIGKSQGAQLYFQVDGQDKKIEVFTTRPDTVFGATYLVLAPEHDMVTSLATKEQRLKVEAYQHQASHKSELERIHLEKEKTGVFTGSFAINPANGQKIPIWIADYVVATYGTGAIMAVPAHDERDFKFAKKFDLPIVQVITSEEALPYSGHGKMQNSSAFDGKPDQEIWDDLLKQIGGKRVTTYKLRDWLVSRQRFWGSPIPIAYDLEGAEHVLPLNVLPVELPQNTEFLPTGQSPLTLATEWKKYSDPDSGQEWQREVDTLDTFVCSSWYYLRFADPHNSQAAFDPEKVKQWLPVDTYIGGAEHAILHLLYARFITKVLSDAGLVNFEEPFAALRNNGVILGQDNRKMSKSKGNVVNQADVVKQYGADTLRVYEMFMAPFEAERPWSVKGIVGVHRFLERVWRLQEKVSKDQPSKAELKIINKVIKRVTGDLAAEKFNVAIAAMMEAMNEFDELPGLAKETYTKLITILNPFAPHITEELWSIQGGEGLASLTGWPSYDPLYLQEDEITYPVQINGKIRAKLVLSASLNEADVLKAVKLDPQVKKYLNGQEIKKEIVIRGRLVSLVY